MKILVNQIETHGDELAKLIDPSFNSNFLKFLLEECTRIEEKRDSLKCDWYDQKLFAIKKLAAESQSSLKYGTERTITFNDNSITMATTVGDNNEAYFESFKLATALNYGNVKQKFAFKILDSSNVLSTNYYNYCVAVLHPNDLDSGDKVKEVFNHVDVIITSSLDLKDTHKKLKHSNSSKYATSKSIVLMDNEEFENLLQLVVVGPLVKLPDTTNLNEHESLVIELEEYCKFDRSVINEIFKNKESMTTFQKLSIVNEYVMKVANNQVYKNEEKVDEWINESKHLFETLSNSEILKNNLNELSNLANNNYSLPTENKIRKGELYEKVYNLSKTDIYGTYLITLATYYKQLCRKTVSSFFEQLDIENLLDVVCDSEHNKEIFIKYILIRGNEITGSKVTSTDNSAQTEFLNLITKIIRVGLKNSKFRFLINNLMNNTIISGTLNTLNSSLKQKRRKFNDSFNDEAVASRTLNFFLLPEVIKRFTKECNELIYSEEYFINIISILLYIPIVYRDEKTFHKNIYMLVYKLILPLVQNQKAYNNLSIIKSLMNHEFLKTIFSKIPSSCNESSENLTNEQKILFEIFLLIHKINEIYPEIPSIYSYPTKLLDIEKCKIIMKEMKKFDYISYLVYYEKDLTESERNTKIFAETLHNRYKGKFTSKLEFSGLKKMSVCVTSESGLENISSVGFSNDPEGTNILKSIGNYNISKSDNVVDITGKMCFIHYPFNPQRIMCFGYSYDYRLGNNETGTTTSVPCEMVNFKISLKKLRSRSAFCVGLGTDNQIYWCGYRSDWSGYKYTMCKYEYTMPETKIIDMNCGYYNCVVLTEDHKIYIQGSCTGFHLDGLTKNYFWYKPRPDEENEKVISFDVGYNYHIYVTDNGKAYGAGNDFMKGINLENTSKNYIQIPFDEGVVPKQPMCNNNSETYRCALMFVENNGRSELWSGGHNTSGLLGQGGALNDSPKFAPLDYDRENIKFTKAQVKYYSGMAITDKGELYGWGSNSNKQLAMTNTQNYYSPIEIPFFKDYYVHDFECGDYHALIYCSPKNNMEKKQFMITGYIRGIADTTGISPEGVLHLKQFDNIKFSWFECGEATCYIGIDGEATGNQGVSIHEGYTCEVTNQYPIKGTMHFWKSKYDGNWHFISQSGYNKMKEEKLLPSICYATKAPISNIQDKEWPEIDEDEMLKSDEDSTYPKYVAHNIHGESKILPIPKSDDPSIFKPELHDMNPFIFYRLARPLKEEAKLPSLVLSKYYEESEFTGLKLEIIPDYSYEKNKDIVKLQQEKYNKTEASIKKFDESLDGELLESIETFMTNYNVDLINDPNIEIPASGCVFNSKELKALTENEIQPRINAFLTFNRNFMKVIPFVILDEEMIKEVTEGKAEVQTDTLSVLFMVSKSLAFKSTKYSYIKKISDSLPVSYSEPEIPINRRLIMHKKDKGKVDNKGEWTTFGSIMKKLKDTNYESLRKSNSSNKAWKACFVGEGSYDAGGPYRESLTNLVDELHSTCLPLLIPTQNNKNNHGLNRDCWTINPSSNSPSHLEMYKFLGALIGMAFRAGHVIDLKLPSMFWKKFIGDPITLDDLNGSDAYAVQAIKDVERNKDLISPDMFEETMNLTYTTQLSNGETISLCSGGYSRRVTFQEVDEYHKLVLNARAEEGNRQIMAMREGFELIYPMSILGILNWRDIEERVRGPSEISVEVLKSITDYSSCSSDNEFVQRFWRVFEEFTTEERSMFLKFAWGRSRLPPADRLNDQRFKLYLMDSYKFTDHNIHFPEAHTCFFQFDLPRYTTDEACKSKILYAIKACGEIDTDGSSYSYVENSADYDSD